MQEDENLVLRKRLETHRLPIKRVGMRMNTSTLKVFQCFEDFPIWRRKFVKRELGNGDERCRFEFIESVGPAFADQRQVNVTSFDSSNGSIVRFQIEPFAAVKVSDSNLPRGNLDSGILMGVSALSEPDQPIILMRPWKTGRGYPRLDFLSHFCSILRVLKCRFEAINVIHKDYQLAR